MITLFLFIQAQNDELQQLRWDFHDINNIQQLDSFISKAEKISNHEAIPYMASAIMRKAEFTSLPLRKYKYFKQGRSKLEKYIDLYPKSVEARYLRVLVQSSCPALLNYSGDLSSDIKFIELNLDDSNLEIEYINLIRKIVNNIKDKSK